MIGIVLNNYEPVSGDVLSPTIRGGVGAGAEVARDRWQRPFAQWTLQFEANIRGVNEDLRMLHYYLKGSGLFLFDGLEDGEITEKQIFGLGDGTATQFFLPVRNVFGPTLVIYVNDLIEVAWTVNESSGLVTFTTAPTSNSVLAWKGISKFKCLLGYSGDTLYKSTDKFKTKGADSIIIREVA